MSGKISSPAGTGSQKNSAKEPVISNSTTKMELVKPMRLKENEPAGEAEGQNISAEISSPPFTRPKVGRFLAPGNTAVTSEGDSYDKGPAYVKTTHYASLDSDKAEPEIERLATPVNGAADSEGALIHSSVTAFDKEFSHGSKPWDFKFAIILIILLVVVNSALVILLHHHKTTNTISAGTPSVSSPALINMPAGSAAVSGAPDSAARTIFLRAGTPPVSGEALKDLPVPGANMNEATQAKVPGEPSLSVSVTAAPPKAEEKLPPVAASVQSRQELLTILNKE